LTYTNKIDIIKSFISITSIWLLNVMNYFHIPISWPSNSQFQCSIKTSKCPHYCKKWKLFFL